MTGLYLDRLGEMFRARNKAADPQRTLRFEPLFFIALNPKQIVLTRRVTHG